MGQPIIFLVIKGIIMDPDNLIENDLIEEKQDGEKITFEENKFQNENDVAIGENKEEIKNKKKVKREKKQKPKQSKFAIWWKWPLIVLGVSLLLSFSFGVLSEIVLSTPNLILAISVIVVFLILSIIGDMIGVAATAATLEPFRAMASRKIRGANEAISLVKNADKVASVFADILGDICGILAGAAGASISLMLIKEYMSSFAGVAIASLVSAIIAALIIFGKAAFKKYSIAHCERIILICGKIMSIFHKQNPKKNKKK